MLNRFFVTFFVLWLLSFNVSAISDNNPFAKNEALNIGVDISWKIDKKSVQATKSASDKKGNYYHLQFDNKKLKLIISNDENGVGAKKFSQLEIEDVKIDGKQSPLFKWCLANQQSHDRFLQQGLMVKKNICSIDGEAGSFVMSLDKETLLSLQNGKRLSIIISPFRTPLELNYDISDFSDMNLALNDKIQAVAIVAPPEQSTEEIKSKCMAEPPAKYINIKPVEYNCDDEAAKKEAESQVIKLVKQDKAKKQKSAEMAAARAATRAAAMTAEKQQQRKLAEEKKQKALAEKLKQEEQLQLEAAAIAASEIKKAQLSDEITQKMLKVCEKYWNKGEHRCYCQKYIKHAPGIIQASSTCK